MDKITQIILNGKYEIQEAGYATVDSFWSKIVSFYQYNRLYLVVDGEAEMKFVNSVYHLKKNMLYFIPAKSIISGECNTIMSHYFVHFHIDTYLNNFLKLIIPPNAENLSTVNEEVFKILVKNAASNKPHDKIVCDGALKILLSNFFRELKNFNPNILRFIDTLSYINSNPEERITVGSLAEMANLNEVYFSNSFKKAFGITLQEYIISQKIEYACTLLFARTMSVKEIAYKLHFTDESHFSRLFKQKCGISPSQFQKYTA